MSGGNERRERNRNGKRTHMHENLSSFYSVLANKKPTLDDKRIV